GAGASLRADYKVGAVTLTSISAFEHNDKRHPEDTDASPFRLIEIDYDVSSNTFTQELRATGGGERYHWVAGAYYLHETLRQNQPIYILQDIDNIFGAGVGDDLAFIAYDNSHQVTN